MVRLRSRVRIPVVAPLQRRPVAQAAGLLHLDERGRSGANNRLFIEAVLWIARTGSPWRDLPAAFGPWNSIYVRFARWADKNVWQNILAVLRDDADFDEVFIDSTIVPAHQHAAGAAKKKGKQALGRSRGGLTTKIHACVEGLGQLARFTLTGGQVADINTGADTDRANAARGGPGRRG